MRSFFKMFLLSEFAPNSVKIHKTACGVLRYSLISAPLFFIISIVIGNINSHKNNVKQGVFDDLSGTAEQIQQQQQKAPAVLDTKNSDIPQ